jgi:hypothetical protein
MPIFLKVNHQLESRMQENCQSGSEGAAKPTFVPTPIIAQPGFASGSPLPNKGWKAQLTGFPFRRRLRKNCPAERAAPFCILGGGYSGALRYGAVPEA